MNFSNSQSEIMLKHLAENFRGSLRNIRSTCDLLKQCGLDDKQIVSRICAFDPTYERRVKQIYDYVSQLPSDFFKWDYSAQKCVSPVKPKEPIYFDFARRRKIEANKNTPVPSNQLWLLFEHGVRQKTVHYLDGFLIFKWRNKGKDFDPKGCFSVVSSKTNSLIKPFGLEFAHAGRKEDTWVLRGLQRTPHILNIVKAQALLGDTAKAVKKKPANWDRALELTLMAFEHDSNSLGIAFSVIQLMEKASSLTVSNETLMEIYKLLRNHENAYKDALAAIERCEILRNADIGGQLRKYRSTLDQILDHQRQIRRAPQWQAAYDDNEAYIDALIQRIRKIKAKYSDAKSVCNAEEFKILYESADIQKAKRAVVSNIIKYYQVTPVTREWLEIKFKNCLAELILTKVDCSKLEHLSSLSFFCRKTIRSKLLDGILRDRYGLSYSQYVTVRRKRKIEQALYQHLGKKPTDEETVAAMKISPGRLREIKQWEFQLKACSPGKGWNSNEFDTHVK